MLNQKGIAFIPILIWSVAILLTGTVAVKEELIKINLSGNGPLIQGADVIPSPSPISTTSPEPTPEPTYIPEQKEVFIPKPTNDPDPIVDCQFKSLGSRKIRSSECNKSFECQVAGQWYIYTSQEKCTQDQNKQASNNPQKIIIQYNDPKVPCSGYKGKVDYMPQSECPAWQDFGRRLEEAEKAFYTCVNNVESDTTKCLKAVLEASRTDIPGCVYCTEEARNAASDKCSEYQKYNTNLCSQTFKTTTDILKNQ